MSEYNAEPEEGIYKMNLEVPRPTRVATPSMASPTVLDETSMPTFPGIESWLQLVQTSNGFQLPPDISSESYVGVDSSDAEEEDDDPQSPALSSSQKYSADGESVQRRANGSFSAVSSRSSACTSLDCDVREDEAVSRIWEKKGEVQTLEQAECNCLQITASLLGDLGGINARSHSTALDVLLEFSRDAVSRCNTVFSCTQCVSTRPASALLLSMASKYISMLYERISLSYNMMERTAKFDDQYEEYHRQQQQDDDDIDFDDENDEAYEDRKVENWTEERLYNWFNSEEAQNPHKRLEVMRCIITLQLSKFLKLVTSLKSEPLEGDCCAPLLTEAAGRTRRLSTQMEQAAVLPIP